MANGQASLLYIVPRNSVYAKLATATLIKHMKTRSFIIGLLGALSVSSLYGAEPSSQTTNKFSWAKNPTDFLNSSSTYYVIVQKKDDVWIVNSINDRKNINSTEEEVLLARQSNTGGWEFNPYFNYIDSIGSSIQCKDKAPADIKDPATIDRTKFTNACDSKFTTTSAPAGAIAGKILGTVVGTVFTFGIGAVGIALDKSYSVYPNKIEVEKVVIDTKLDFLLNKINSAKTEYVAAASRIQQEWELVARQTDTKFTVTDSSKGFAKNFDANGAKILVRYKSSFPKEYLLMSNYPIGEDKVDTFIMSNNNRLSQLAAKRVTIQPNCTLNSHSIGIFNVNIPSCPAEIVLEKSSPSVNLPLVVNGIKTNLTPHIAADDKSLAARMSSNGITIDNRTDDFIDIFDVSLSINGKVRTLSGGNSPLITIPPRATYPRENEASKFSIGELIDREMKSAISFNNLTYSEARNTKVTSSISIRYSIDGKTKTLRGASATSILEQLQ